MRRSLITACVFVAGFGCTDGEPTQPDASAPGTFSALYNSEPFKSAAGKSTGTAGSSGRFQVVAFDSSRTNPITVSLYLFNIAKPGIYPLGVGESAIGGYVDLKVGNSAYHQLGTGNGGAIVLTHVSPTRLAGKFYMSFLFPTEFGPGGSDVALTEATFDVPITASGSIAVPENKGSWAVGTVGTKSFRSALFEPYRDFTGVHVIRMGNSDYEISLSLKSISAPGTYKVGPSSAGGISARSQRYDWAMYQNEEVGTMTIESITSNRVIGSINVTLRAQVGSEPGGALPIRFSFDIALAPP